MNVIGLDHVQLAMPAGGEDRARAFYRGVLGLAEVPKPASLSANGGCWFAGGGVHLHLGREDGFRPAAKAHPALLVENLDDARAAFARAGVEFRDGKPLDGYRRGDVADPFGNRIEIMQRV